MAQVKVYIRDVTGAKITPVEVPNDVTMRRLIPALVTKMNLPVTDGAERLIEYRLLHRQSGKTLDTDDTLAGIGVQENDELTLLPEVVAGAWSPGYASPEQQIFDAVELSAPVLIPTRDSLAIGLVPSDIVYRLEEYRADEMRWQAVAWTFTGAVLGIIVNWVTSNPMTVPRTSLIVIAVFVIMAILTGFAARDYRKRADDMKATMLTYRSASPEKHNSFKEKPS
ncbi:MAG: EsaB/YukD family protein [Ardenticatenaceae bacterium]|nr:EsaB/YukD family protein [Ardenticatenaceae bacterium]